jgi:preprotein translocase subunit YajC
MTRVLDFLPLLLGAPESASGAAGGTATGGMPIWTTLIMFGLIIVVFYFLMIRPQNKKQKETKKMLESLRKGDRVSTIGGMRGSVVSVKEDVVLLRVDDNTKLEFSKSAIAQVLERKEEPEDAKELKKE